MNAIEWLEIWAKLEQTNSYYYNATRKEYFYNELKGKDAKHVRSALNFLFSRKNKTPTLRTLLGCVTYEEKKHRANEARASAALKQKQEAEELERTKLAPDEVAKRCQEIKKALGG